MMMANKPILFSAPMVRAILENKKTMTRRVLKLPKWIWWTDEAKGMLHFATDGEGYGDSGDLHISELQEYYSPRKVGDILWVRETWLKADDGFYYKADIKVPSESENIRKIYGYKWKPSIHMPKNAARIYLKITNVRVERVQNITEEDAIAEGISPWDDACYENNGWSPTLYDPDSGGSPIFRDGFQGLWDYLNEKRGYGWEQNPWVWVYKFERVNNIDESKTA